MKKPTIDVYITTNMNGIAHVGDRVSYAAGDIAPINTKRRWQKMPAPLRTKDVVAVSGQHGNHYYGSSAQVEGDSNTYI